MFVLITFVYFLDDKREEHQNCEYWPDQCYRDVESVHIFVNEVFKLFFHYFIIYIVCSLYFKLIFHDKHVFTFIYYKDYNIPGKHDNLCLYPWSLLDNTTLNRYPGI